METIVPNFIEDSFDVFECDCRGFYILSITVSLAAYFFLRIFKNYLLFVQKHKPATKFKQLLNSNISNFHLYESMTILKTTIQ